MSEKKPKLKHYIATHTFHSAKVRKEFREVNSHRKRIQIGSGMKVSN